MKIISATKLIVTLFVFVFASMAAISQKATIAGTWELVSVINNNPNPVAMPRVLQIFDKAGNFWGIDITNKDACTRMTGTYKMKNDSTYVETLIETYFKMLEGKSIEIRYTVDNTTLKKVANVDMGNGTVYHFEEVWRRVEMCKAAK